MIRRVQDRAVVRLHLWLETEKGVFFGLGRWKLLEKIQSGQSLKGAAESLGMSYRAAWGKIKNTEKVLGVALIEKKAGKRAGYRLTADGVAMITGFARWFAEVERYALRRAGKLLPCRPIAYSKTELQTPAGPSSDPEQEPPLP